MRPAKTAFDPHLQGRRRRPPQPDALDQSVVVVRAGETLTERQALEALMLPSANNVAALLAVHDAGQHPRLRRRDERSRRRNGDGGRPATPTPAASKNHGLDRRRPDQAGAAGDGRPDLRRNRRHALDGPAGRRAEVPNFNGLVGHEGYVGIKTGSDSAAGGCLLFAKQIHSRRPHPDRARRGLRPARRRTRHRRPRKRRPARRLGRRHRPRRDRDPGRDQGDGGPRTPTATRSPRVTAKPLGSSVGRGCRCGSRSRRCRAGARSTPARGWRP